MTDDFDIKGVTLGTALAWARGEMHERDLATTQSEVTFWNELGDLRSYRAALREIIRLNTPSMIVHACHETVCHKLNREGATPVYSERRNWRGREVVCWRYIVPPHVMQSWTRKFRRAVSAPALPAPN